MLTFLTLFLGLVYDVHPVELSVSAEVASVELFLNDERIGELTGKPWSLDCDFGDTLRPHKLVAVARDAAGREVARDRQWINLPRSRAEAILAFKEDSNASSPTVRLTWRSLERLSPNRIQLTFNGEEIAFDNPGHIELPSYNPQRIQHLAAEIEFPNGLRSQAELIFGGTFGGQVSSENTAIPLTRVKGPKKLKAEDLAGVLTIRGEPLTVVATENQGGQIIVVQDPSARPILRAVAGQLRDSSKVRPLTTVRLDKGEQIRVMSTHSAHSPSHASPYDLFPISNPFDDESGDLAQLIARLKIDGSDQFGRVADAVAAAGVHAAATNQPRAVVLILGPEDLDASRFSVDQVRNYLRDLHVPLFVWGAGRPNIQRSPRDQTPLANGSPWGEVRDVGSGTRLLAATAKLHRSLSSQRIAWVKGSHLPHEIQLTHKVKGFDLAQ